MDADWWARGIALAALSVALLGLGVRVVEVAVRLIEGASRVKVKLDNGFLAYPDELSDLMLLLEAGNIGNRTVTLSGEGFELPDRKTMVFPAPQGNVTFPHDLEPGKNCTIWVEAWRVARSLKEAGYKGEVKLVGFYRDQTDKLYRSRPYTLDVDDWAKDASGARH